MATVVVFTVPLLGHIFPQLPIVAELVRRGDRVVYYCAEAHRTTIEATGAEFRAVPYDFGPLLSLPFPRASDLSVEWLRCSESCLPQLIAEMKELNPSYVFSDFMAHWGRYAARVVGVPLALMASSVPFQPHMFPPFPLISALDVGLSLERARKVLELRAISKRLASRYGVSRMRLPFDMLNMEGDLILSATSRIFSPGSELLDERFHFIGACFEPRAGVESHPLPPLDDRPLVYVSLGTIFNTILPFYRACVEALSDGRYQVIMAIGKRLEPSALGPLPSHIHAVKYAPQLEILRRASVFISHGGMNSTTEALCNGVPLLVFPQSADQPVIASRIEALRVGQQLRKRSPADIRKAVDAMVADPSIRERCRDVGRTLIEAGGYKRAADILQEFGARKSTLPSAATQATTATG